jgi:hypothetical protein
VPEWLTSAGIADSPSSPARLAIQLLLSLLFGAGVGLVYRLSHGREEGSSTTLFTTLVLLSALICMVSIVIGNSVARAFSLVGALSIVRFRTVVDDTRDTAFVIFAVIVGMAVGADLIAIPLIAIPLVGAASIVLSRMAVKDRSKANSGIVIVIRMALGNDPDGRLSPSLAKHVRNAHLTSTGTARQGAAFDLTYQAEMLPESSMLALVSELNRIEGVMSVEIREA